MCGALCKPVTESKTEGKGKLLLCIGGKDALFPKDVTLRSYEVLDNLKVSFELFEDPEAGHEILAPKLQKMQAYFAEVMP